MTTSPVPLVLQAIEALKRGDRRGGAALLQQDLRQGSPSPDRCRTISRLAAEIGEIDMAIEASGRSLSPPTLDKLLAHWALLATYGRADEAMAEIERLPRDVREHHAILQFQGSIAGEQARFEEAEELLRRAISTAPDASASWFSLATLKTFVPGDPDIQAMESLAQSMRHVGPEALARIRYALGKALDDCGEYDRAFAHYQAGAAIRRESGAYDSECARTAADRVIRNFTPSRMRALSPSKIGTQRSIFVTGLPRSGTTLVQQMLAAHSRVSDGDEVNLFRPALIPTLDFTMDGALAYQQRVTTGDPWGDVARDYAHFIDMRFRSPGLIVDKSLGQSTFVGLLLHSLPEAQIVWLRRNPEDTAISCFRTSFSASTHWSWSIAEIAEHFRIEDALFEHWRPMFGDRILVVPYEDLVTEPGKWMTTIAEHVGLDVEPAMERFHERKRTVRTASVAQVRAPVSTARIGAAQRYPEFVKQFRAAYEA